LVSDEVNAPPPGSAALPKRERIARRQDFLDTYEQGRKFFARYCVLFFKQSSFGHPRIGITSTKKIGKAHDRNRLRRWTREVYRLNRNGIGLDKESTDFVINIKPGARQATYAQYSTDLTNAFRRAMKEKQGGP